MPDYILGPSVASDDDDVVVPETVVIRDPDITTDTETMIHYPSIPRMATVESELERAEDARASQTPGREVKLHFYLPSGPNQFYSNEQVIVSGPKGDQFKMRNIVAGDNPNSLEAFINEQYDNVSDLLVTFCLGKTREDEDTRKQLTRCLTALIRLADKCCFAVKAEYSPEYKQKHPLEGVVSLREIVVSRFRKLAGEREIKIRKNW